VECWAKRALSVRVCNLRDFKKALTDGCLDESKEARASGALVGAIRGLPQTRLGYLTHCSCDFPRPDHDHADAFFILPEPPRLRYEPRCKVLPTRKDSGAHTDDASPCGSENSRCVQEFRQELQAAETKDKKFTKRKTVLKKIVANITMGNDSACCCDAAGAFIVLTGNRFTVSPLFTDVVQCLGTPLLEIKKSMSAYSITSLVCPSGLSAQWFTSFSSIMDGPRQTLSI